MKRLLFIYNPNAGIGVIRSRLADVIDIFVAADYEVTIHPTQGYLDARNRIESITNLYDLIVCAGGDGTLDEVVSGLIKRGLDIPVGYIPTGSTNDFAKSMSIPATIVEAATIAVNGRPFRCDIGLFNNDYFTYVAAFGIFTDVSYETERHMKNALGHMAYILEGAKRIFNIPSYHIKVTHDHGVIEDEFIFGMVTNSTSVGGFKGLIGRDVIFNDGVFEVNLIKRPYGPVELNQLISAMVNRNLDSSAMYTFTSGSICFESEEEIPWTLDGEYGGDHKAVEILNLQQKLQIMVQESVYMDLMRLDPDFVV